MLDLLLVDMMVLHYPVQNNTMVHHGPLVEF